MAIAISANGEDQPASALSPTGINAQRVEGGGASSVQMGQENVIALLLQQQEEVLREIRDQKKGIALSQENKQDIARLVLSSLKKVCFHEQPATSDPPHHPPLGPCTASRARTSSKRTGKKRAIARRRQRNSRTPRDQDRAKKHPSPPTTTGSGPYEYSSSRDQNNGDSPSAAVGPACFPLESVTSTHEHRSGTPPSTTMVIRQRVEKEAEQVEVSLDGLWLPSLSPSSGLGSPGAAAGRRRSSSNGGATTARGGRWADSVRPSASMPQARKIGKLHVYDGREKLPRTRKVRPVSVDSHASKKFVLSQHQKCHEGDFMPARSGLENRRRRNIAEGNSSREGYGMITDDDDDDYGGDYGDDHDHRGGGSGNGRSPPLMGNCAQRETIGDGSNWRGDSAAMTPSISQDTASMLQRSHALVARAKACYGQAVRSSTADYINRERNVDLQGPPCGRATATFSPTSGRHQGNNVENIVAGSDVDGGVGEAGGVLFASSPCSTAGASLSASLPLGDVAEEEGETQGSPPALAGAARSRTQDGQIGGVGHSTLGHTAHADTETCENGTGSAVRQSIISGGAEEEREDASEHAKRGLSDAALQAHLAATDGTRALEPVGGEARQDKRGSLVSTTASVGGGQGRRRGGSEKKAKKKRGEELSRGNGGAEDESPAKIDTEWENEIAKNILSLYQTKLKADLDVKKGAKENELMLKQRGYLTIEEEEDSLYEKQHQEQLVRYSNRAATAAPGCVRFPSNRDKRDTTKPSTAVAKSTSGKPSDLEIHTTVTGDVTSPTRTGGKGVNVATPSQSSLRPATVATKPREVVVGRDLSLGRQPQSPLRTATGTSDPVDKASGDHAVVTVAKGRGGFRGSKAITVPTRGGGEAVVVVPKQPRPIWFAGSGAIQAEWSALPGGARVVRDLEGLEEQGRYTKYVAVVEGLLTAYLRADDQRGPAELVKKLWRQLVATCIAFGVRSIDNRRFERALELLKRAETLLSRQVLDKRASQELQAFVHDAYGLYFLRRGKSSAALDYVQKAMKTHVRMRDWGHVTKCHLHSSVVLSKLNRHDEALRCLGQVLSMVEEGNLDVGGNSPQKLCLVAICYHNMAVEQLILRHAGEACMSSQNARRLARLCLSYSNRWLHSFEGTHKLALAELARSLPSSGGSSLGESSQRGGDGESEEEQREILKRLTKELFS